VAFAALLAASALAAPALAQQRNVDGGPPQQGVPGTTTQQAAPQANYMADYHADYRVKTPGEPKDDNAQPAPAQRESSRNRPSPVLERMLGRTPGAWGR
jgi:hypothetical protein